MKISTVKIISLLFFIFSAFYLYTAYQIRVFSFDEDAAFNAKTFPIYLGYFGMFIAGLKIALPEKTSEEVDQQFLNYKKNFSFNFNNGYLWFNHKICWFLFKHIFIFNIILLFSRREKVAKNVYAFLSFCSHFYVFNPWTIRHLSNRSNS